MPAGHADSSAEQGDEYGNVRTQQVAQHFLLYWGQHLDGMDVAAQHATVLLGTYSRGNQRAARGLGQFCPSFEGLRERRILFIARGACAQPRHRLAAHEQAALAINLCHSQPSHSRCSGHGFEVDSVYDEGFVEPLPRCPVPGQAHQHIDLIGESGDLRYKTDEKRHKAATSGVAVNAV
ncbi:hypothetical protein [Kribbella sp. NPDC000426]|uniref:hypothetical protein n=1 Tax=Kribbella sp. NPDC000426 TaxID=3154255 RepID=UPI003320C666